MAVGEFSHSLSILSVKWDNKIQFYSLVFFFFFFFSIFLLQLWPQVSFSSTIVMLIDASTVDKGGNKIKEKIKKKKKLAFYFKNRKKESWTLLGVAECARTEENGEKKRGRWTGYRDIATLTHNTIRPLAHINTIPFFFFFSLLFTKVSPFFCWSLQQTSSSLSIQTDVSIDPDASTQQV